MNCDGDCAGADPIRPPHRRRYATHPGNRVLMVDHCRARIAEGLAKVAPFVLGLAVRNRDVARGLSRVQDASGGGPGNRFGIDVIGQAGAAVRHSGTDIAESTFMQDPQRRHGARSHRKGMDWPLRAAPQQRIRLPALPNAQHPRPDIVAVLEALHRANPDELFGEPTCGRLS